MARFDVYPNPDDHEAEFIPYFLDVQNDHINGLQTRVLVPLWCADMLPSKLNDLNPKLEVKGVMMVMDTPSLGAVSMSSLKPSVTNLSAQQLVIQNALDTLFGGY